ncbi:MAG: hypothetical protein Alpg2KO_16590 [Alphaproteobacteria bacterium]
MDKTSNDTQAKPWKTPDRGAAVTPYGLVVGLIAVVGLAAVTTVGSSVNSLMTEVADKTGDAVDGQIEPDATPAPSVSATCNASDQIFDSAGQYSISVPANCGTMTVLAWGAGGGGGNDQNNSGLNPRGGAGAFVTADITVSSSDVITAFVGGGGTNGGINNGTCQAAPFNGGGPASNAAGTGGGASDIRIGGANLTDRVLVAAGGGGGGYVNNQHSQGGPGGINTGQNGGNGSSSTQSVPTGGTQSSGGAHGVWSGGSAPSAWGLCTTSELGFSIEDGQLGYGGSGTTCGGCYGGGGGGGYYGGGGAAPYTAGAGGSSLVPSGGSGLAGSGQQAGSPTNPDRPGNAGRGADEEADAPDGAIVIKWSD